MHTINEPGLTSMTVNVPLEIVREAAAKRADFHRDRYNYWKGENDNAIKEIQTTGVRINVAAITGGYRDEVDLVPGIKDRIYEAQSKMAEHKEREEYFNAIGQALNYAEASIPLTIRDVRELHIKGV